MKRLIRPASARDAMYLSISILCLSVSLLIGFHFGASTARAGYDGSGLVRGLSGPYLLLEDGSTWQVQVLAGTPSFNRETFDVPTNILSTLKLWGPNVMVASNDEVYTLIDGTWVNMGIPGDPTNIEPTTWEQLKSKYDNN